MSSSPHSTSPMNPSDSRPKRGPCPREFLYSFDTGNTKTIVNLVDDEDPNERRGSPLKKDPKDLDYQDNPPQTQQQVRTKANKRLKADKSNDELMKLIDRLESEKSKIKEELSEVRKKRTSDRKSLQEEKKRRIELQKEVKELKSQDLESNQKTKQLHLALEEQQQKFNEATRDLMAKVESQSYPCQPDDILRQRFTTLFLRCKDWVRDWIHQTRCEFPVAKINGTIENCISPDASQSVSKAIEELKLGGRSGVKLIVFAKLTYYVWSCFLKTPFAFCKPVFESISNVDEVLASFVEIFNKKDGSKAAMWRAETMRLLRPRLGGEACELKSDHSRTLAIGRVCLDMSQKLVGELQAEFLRSMDIIEKRKCVDELQSILWDFALLALEMWCQKSTIRIVDPKDIHALSFSFHSDIMQPHVSMAVEDENSRYERQKIDLVLTPAIALYGDAQGENPETRKIISKATVIILDRLELKRKSDAAEQAHSLKRRKTSNDDDDNNEKYMMPTPQSATNDDMSEAHRFPSQSGNTDNAASDTNTTAAPSRGLRNEQTIITGSERQMVIVNVPPFPSSRSQETDALASKSKTSGNSSLSTDSSFMDIIKQVEQGDTYNQRQNQPNASTGSRAKHQSTPQQHEGRLSQTEPKCEETSKIFASRDHEATKEGSLDAVTRSSTTKEQKSFCRAWTTTTCGPKTEAQDAKDSLGETEDSIEEHFARRRAARNHSDAGV